jgi:type I restriction enzyme R subunit
MSSSDSLRYGLKADHIWRIQQALAQFPAISSVTLYGSRAKGNYRPGSDIDITLHTDGEAPKNLLFDVMGALDELDLIYGFDVSLFAHLDNPNFIDHINRVGVEFYQRERFQTELNNKERRVQYQQAGYESEATLEESLIKRLCGELSNHISEPPVDELVTDRANSGLGYSRITIKNSDELRANLKRQLEIHNNIELSDTEFNKVLNHLDKGNVFDRAETLRNRFELQRDDGTSKYIEFFNLTYWCQNQYQVTNQITQTGKRENRYDVTLLINGLPLVQIELKRRGVELKEAFNQINRYHRDSFAAADGLFNYVQLFVISNGMNIKY